MARRIQGRPARESGVEQLKPGQDPRPAIGDLYRHGRSYPHKPPHDYQQRELAPDSQPPQPGFDEYRATYRQARNSPVSPAPDESQPQFACEKSGDLNDTREAWTRGMGSQNPHPAFDRNVDSNGRAISGYRYDTKIRR